MTFLVEVERFTDARVWQSWGMMHLEVAALRIYLQPLLDDALSLYLSKGRSPEGIYRVGGDSHLGLFVYEKVDGGTMLARPILNNEYAKSGIQ